MRHQILELESIPRDKKVLKATIAEARGLRRRRQLVNLAAFSLVVIALAILIFGQMQQTESAVLAQEGTHVRVFLPVISYEMTYNNE
jgi:hypothetical protein